MSRRTWEKVAATAGSLLALTGHAHAVEAGGPITPTSNRRSRLQALLHSAAVGGISALAAETESYLTGSVLTEAIYQTNYTDGDNDTNDRFAGGWARIEIGARVELQDRVEAKVSVAYEGEFGNRTVYDEEEDESGDIALNEGWILLKQFLGSNIHARVGRMPVNWNLRKGYGSFLLDSRANRPVVTSWDGLRGYLQLENWTFSPYVYVLNEAQASQGIEPRSNSNNDTNALLGVTLDWQPDQTTDDTVFVTASAIMERNAPVDVRDSSIGVADVIGEELITYQFGAEWALDSGFTFFGEFATQDGTLDSDRGFGGYGYYLGGSWSFEGPYKPILSLQYDWMSGDDDPNDGDYDAFVTPWEGVSDTYIVEHERYGELSELMVGNLSAIKLKLEYSFFNDSLLMHAIAATYMMDEEVNGDDDFGDEFDIGLTWNYDRFTTIKFFGGVFLPGDGYAGAADAYYNNASGTAGDDMIWMMATNVGVEF